MTRTTKYLLVFVVLIAVGYVLGVVQTIAPAHQAIDRVAAVQDDQRRALGAMQDGAAAVGRFAYWTRWGPLVTVAQTGGTCD